MDRRLDIALTTREFLLDYFKDRRTDVYNGLRQAHANICLNLIRYYISSGQPQRIEEAEQRLLKYQPQWTLNDGETAGDITPPASRKENKSANRENADMGKRNRFTIHTASPRQHRDMTYIFRL